MSVAGAIEVSVAGVSVGVVSGSIVRVVLAG